MQGLIITAAGSFSCLIERGITANEGHLYHTCNHESELRDYSGKDGLIYSAFSEKRKRRRASMDPEKYATQNLQQWEVWYLLIISVALRPLSFLTQLPLPILLRTSVLRLFSRYCLPHKMQTTMLTLKQRMYHIWSSWCIHSFFLCFLNSSLYLLTEQRCTSWYIAPR